MDPTQRIIEEDSSWETALQCAQMCLKTPPVLTTLVKNSWGGVWETREFLRGLGFVGCNAKCLLRAAELPSTGDSVNAQSVERAVGILGVRMAAVVVAINYVCDSVLETNPPEKLWVTLFRQMMNVMEVGYHFGGRAEGIGNEGGVLMGFVKNAGLAILLAQHPREYSELYARTRGVNNADFVRQSFGCESYQVGAMAVQQLGFGSEIAIASALAVGNLRHDLIEVSDSLLTWKAAFQWIDALEQGQSYPRDMISRSFFEDISPPQRGQACSPALSLLYSQVAQVRRRASNWSWHLPTDSYEDTAKLITTRKQQADKYKTAKGKMVVELR